VQLKMSGQRVSYTKTKTELEAAGL
jgi:hypothetical protein